MNFVYPASEILLRRKKKNFKKEENTKWVFLSEN